MTDYHTLYIDDLCPHAQLALEAYEDLILVEEPDDAEFLWFRQGHKNWHHNLMSHQILNHHPGESAMVIKGQLARNLHEHSQQNPDASFSHTDFYPETYRLYDPTERQAFLDQLPTQDDPQKAWVLKPSDKAESRGVQIIWQMDKLKELLHDTSKMTVKYQGVEYDYLAQRYIQDIFLLHQRKAEMRFYWLLASLDPLIVYLYPEGIVRLCPHKFTYGDYDNPKAHLGCGFGEGLERSVESPVRLKWGFDELQDYLLETGTVGPDWWDGVLVPQLHKILRCACHATVPRMLDCQPDQGHFFGLYGMDIILDNSLRPWLTELQLGPALTFDDHIKSQIIPAMLHEALQIAVEIKERKMINAPLTHIAAVDTFCRVEVEATAMV